MPIIHSGRVANCLYLLCKQMQYIQATLFFQFNSIEFCVSRSALSSKSSAYQLLSAYIESPPNFPSSRKGNPPSSRLELNRKPQPHSDTCFQIWTHTHAKHSTLQQRLNPQDTISANLAFS